MRPCEPLTAFQLSQRTSTLPLPTLSYCQRHHRRPAGSTQRRPPWPYDINTATHPLPRAPLQSLPLPIRVKLPPLPHWGLPGRLKQHDSRQWPVDTTATSDHSTSPTDNRADSYRARGGQRSFSHKWPVPRSMAPAQQTPRPLRRQQARSATERMNHMVRAASATSKAKKARPPCTRKKRDVAIRQING